MHLYLFRHGIAVDRDDPACPPDPERTLSKTGVDRTRAAARGLRALGFDPAIVLSSPYVRARQTADIVLQELAMPAETLRKTSALTPTADPDAVLKVVAAVDADAVLCAGHAPNLDHVIARATGAPRVFTSLKKAGLAVLAMASAAPGRGELVALYPPRALRALGA